MTVRNPQGENVLSEESSLRIPSDETLEQFVCDACEHRWVSFNGTSLCCGKIARGNLQSTESEESGALLRTPLLLRGLETFFTRLLLSDLPVASCGSLAIVDASPKPANHPARCLTLDAA